MKQTDIGGQYIYIYIYTYIYVCVCVCVCVCVNGFPQSRDSVNTTVWMHYLDTNETHGKN